MTTLVDTGPIVAFLNRRDAHHAWAVEQFKTLRKPFYTCDAVLTEATHLLGRSGLPREHVLDLVGRGAVVVDFDPNAEAKAVATLLARYASTPMDYADACLVRMSERDDQATVLTLDGDFYIYRRHGGAAIPVIVP